MTSNEHEAEDGEPHVDETATQGSSSAQQRRLARLAARLATLRAQRAEMMQPPTANAVVDVQPAIEPPQEGSLVARPFRTGFFGALGVAFAYMAYLAVDSIRNTLILIAIAAVVAIGLEPLVQLLLRRGFRRGGAVATVFVMLLAALVGAGYAIVPPIVNETVAFVQSLPEVVEGLQTNAVIADLDARFQLIEQLQDSGVLQELGGGAADRVLTVGLAIAGVLLDLGVILILTLFFLAGFPRIKQATFRLAPASRRHRVHELGDKILAQMGGYLGGMTLVALQAGIVAGVFAAIVGLPYPWAIGLAATILDFVPIVGPVIIGVAMTLLGFTQSLLIGVIAGLFYLVQHLFEAYWLYPRVMRHQVHISTAAVVVAILVGAALLGVPGALLAVPVAAGVQLIIREVVIPMQDRS